MRAIIDSLQRRMQQLKMELMALYLAYQDPRTPLYAKIAAALVVGYAFSPIDLIPDFVPVLGYLDDLLIVPLGIMVALALIPPVVMADCRQRAKLINEKPVNRRAAAVIIGVWILLAAAAVLFIAGRII